MMKVTVKSELIEVIAYDHRTQFLKLSLTDGQIRAFDEVPSNIVEDLIAARSPGTFYAKMIRGRFPRRD